MSSNRNIADLIDTNGNVGIRNTAPVVDLQITNSTNGSNGYTNYGHPNTGGENGAVFINKQNSRLDWEHGIVFAGEGTAWSMRVTAKNGLGTTDTTGEIFGVHPIEGSGTTWDDTAGSNSVTSAYFRVMGNGKTFVDDLVAEDSLTAPTYATDTDANNNNANTTGGLYFNTSDGVLKTYDGSQWRRAGDAPVYTDTFDYLQDGSALSLHRFNNNGNPSPDSGGVYPASFHNGVTYTTTSKFGSHSINTMSDGTYCDIAGLPLIEAVSIWYYCVGTSQGYIVDFRHDGPSNGRSYLYTHSGGGDQHIDWGDDTTTTGKTGDMWINGSVFNSGQYNFYNGNWYHIVMSRNATDTHRQWDQGIRIGNRSDGTSNGNAGYFDQVRTFNRKLTQEDVDLLYAEQERP